MMKHLFQSLCCTLALVSFACISFAQNCSDPDACNYNPASTGGVFDAPCLFIETVAVHTTGDLAGMTTYRLHFQAANATDFVTSVFGNATTPLALTTTTTFYQNALGGASSEPQNPLLFPSFPDLIYDSYVTIGLSETADGTAGENAPSLIASPDQDWITAFDPGSGVAGSDIIINDVVGGIWFIYNGDTNGQPDADNRVLIAQLTTDGELGGQVNVQYFPAGGDAVTVTLSLDSACQEAPEDCTYPDGYPDNIVDCAGDCLNDADSDQICDEVDDCIGSLDALGVCNGNCTADADADGICDDVDDCVGALDACGVCNGPGEVYDCGCADIPVGDCDCNGNQLDAVDVCGGNCTADADDDGICDNVDDCVGDYDACGVCNGPGAIYDCGCEDIPAGDCDCNGNQLDALGVCGGNCTSDADQDGICDADETAGCTDETACNYNPDATDDDGSCAQFDACGICDGPGAIYDCGCSDIPAGDCDCNGNQLDALDVCGGTCTADADADGICDDVDDCVGALDACGVCNGPGAIYDCGCSDIPDGDCDCDGNQLDAIGICIGRAGSSADIQGIKLVSIAVAITRRNV